MENNLKNSKSFTKDAEKFFLAVRLNIKKEKSTLEQSVNGEFLMGKKLSKDEFVKSINGLLQIGNDCQAVINEILFEKAEELGIKKEFSEFIEDKKGRSLDSFLKKNNLKSKK